MQWLLVFSTFTFTFTFTFTNWRSVQSFYWKLFFCKKNLALFSYQKTEFDISLFSSQNLRFGFHISLSLLDFTSWYLVNAWVVLSRQLTTRGKPITICKSIPESSSIISDSSLLPCLAQFWKKENSQKNHNRTNQTKGLCFAGRNERAKVMIKWVVNTWIADLSDLSFGSSAKTTDVRWERRP